MTCFDHNNLPTSGWGDYVKIAATKAVRMDGAFKVWTPEGLMYCEDGWLALDSRGNPYPIAAEEFEHIYRPQGDVYITEERSTSVQRRAEVANYVDTLPRFDEGVGGTEVASYVDTLPRFDEGGGGAVARA